MNRWSTLPLGVDIGSTRVRIACAELDRTGRICLRAVVARNVPARIVASDGSISEPHALAALIAEARAELGVRECRAVAALGAPAATLRVVQLPRMTRIERIRAARFEAERFTAGELDDHAPIVRIYPAEKRDCWAIGAVRADMLATCAQTLRLARLRPVAIDHTANALRRALTSGDAIADVGSERSTLYAFSERGPLAWTLAHGGAEVTRSIAGELAIDYATAERRKRILGVCGAGTDARARLVEGLAALVEAARLRLPIQLVSLTGNGARLTGLKERLETACGAAIDIPAAASLDTRAYPIDVVRAAAPDWSLAVGLALWSTAA